MTVGLAITTHQRPGILSKALANWAKVLDGVDMVVVIHDLHGEGVAKSKNRCIAALMDAGIEHHFYADDDVWAITPNWWKLYTEDPEPHLMHCWGKSRLVSDDGHYTTWTHPRGVMLYTHRSVIDKVGGMRLDFGPNGGGEHVEWSRRIHNAGFTTHRYQDLTAARHGIWHCEDYTRATPSTIGSQQLEATAQHRHEVYAKYRGNTDWVDYRPTPDETAAAQ